MIKKFINIIIIIFFCVNIVIPSNSFAQAQFSLPEPGLMVGPSMEFAPALIKGLKVYPNNPLKFDFVVDTGNSDLDDETFKNEADRLIKYFMASLTVPEDDIWVNLSPYEKDRIIPEKFALTGMGRDLLGQDYILKQLTSSLMYPDDKLGQKFWDKVYAKAYEQFGVTDIPVNTFNKVWIVPEKAVVYTNKDMAFVIESKLKVMLEEDYLALKEGEKTAKEQNEVDDKVANIRHISSQMIKEIIIPAIEKEVNGGKNFATLRQVYNSMILATWFKRNLKESVLGKVYVGTNKVKGIDLEDKNIKEKIYQQYLQAFKKGVYDYVKEEFDPVTQQIIPRKYFSGGIKWGGKVIDHAMRVSKQPVRSIEKAIKDQSMGALKTVEAGFVDSAMKANSARKNFSEGEGDRAGEHQESQEFIPLKKGETRNEIFTGDFWIHAGMFYYKISVKDDKVVLGTYWGKDGVKADDQKEMMLGRKDFYSVGRAEDNNLRPAISDATLSKNHFQFRVNKTNIAGQFEIQLRDLNSSNGTEIFFNKAETINTEKVEGFIQRGQNFYGKVLGEAWVQAGMYFYRIKVTGNDIRVSVHTSRSEDAISLSERIFKLPMSRPLVIGRAENPDVLKMVGDDSLSREHFSFIVMKAVEEGAFYFQISDLNSSNGTYLSVSRVIDGDGKKRDDLKKDRLTIDEVLWIKAILTDIKGVEGGGYGFLVNHQDGKNITLEPSELKQYLFLRKKYNAAREKYDETNDAGVINQDSFYITRKRMIEKMNGSDNEGLIIRFVSPWGAMNSLVSDRANNAFEAILNSNKKYDSAMTVDFEMASRAFIDKNLREKRLVTEKQFVNIIRGHSDVQNWQGVREIIRAQVPGFDDRVLRGVSDKEAEELFAKDEEFALSLGCKRRTVAQPDGTKKQVYEGFGYVHAYEGHNGEFSGLRDFDARLKGALNQKGIIIISRNNFIDIIPFINEDGSFNGQFSVLITKANGELVTFYPADDQTPIGENKQKSLLTMIESLSREFTLPVYQPSEKSVRYESGDFYIKVYEGYYTNYFLRYTFDAQGKRAVEAVRVDKGAESSFLEDKQEIDAKKTISKMIAKFYEGITEELRGNITIDLKELDTADENKEIQKRIGYFQSLTKEDLRQKIRTVEKLYDFYEGGIGGSLPENIINELRQMSFHPSDVILMCAVLLDQKDPMKTKDIFMDWMKYHPWAWSGGILYGNLLKVVLDLKKEDLDSLSMDLLRERYGFMKRVFGPGLFRIFDIFHEPFFQINTKEDLAADKRTVRVEGTPKVTDKEFFQYLKGIDPRVAQKVVLYSGGISNDSRLRLFLQNPHENFKEDVARDQDPQFYNLNDPVRVLNSFKDIVSSLNGDQKLFQKLQNSFKDEVGADIEEFSRNTEKVEVYADEIADILYSFVKDKKNKGLFKSAKSLTKNDLLNMNRMVDQLIVRKNNGVEFGLMKRNLDEIELGKIFGDCTAPPNSLDNEGGVKYAEYIDDWFFNPHFQVLKLFYTKQGRKKGQEVMKVHLVKTKDKESNEDVLIVDAHEVIPQMVKENEESYDKELGMQKKLFFNLMVKQVFEFAKKNGISKVYANKISNDPDISFEYGSYINESAGEKTPGNFLLDTRYQTDDYVYPLKMSSKGFKDNLTEVSNILGKMGKTQSAQDFVSVFTAAVGFLKNSDVQQEILTLQDIWDFFTNKYFLVEQDSSGFKDLSSKGKENLYQQIGVMYGMASEKSDYYRNDALVKDLERFLLSFIKNENLGLKQLNNIIFQTYMICSKNDQEEIIVQILKRILGLFGEPLSENIKSRVAFASVAFLNYYPSAINAMSREMLIEFLDRTRQVDFLKDQIDDKFLERFLGKGETEKQIILDDEELPMVARIHLYACAKIIYQKTDFFESNDAGVLGFVFEERDRDSEERYLDAFGFWMDFEDLYKIIDIRESSDTKILNVIKPLWFKGGISLYVTDDSNRTMDLNAADNAQMTQDLNTGFDSTAAANDPKKGGIDLNPKKIKIEKRGQDIDFNIPDDPSLIDLQNIQGFTPVIIQIIPTNLPLLLGRSHPDQDNIQKLSKN